MSKFAGLRSARVSPIASVETPPAAEAAGTSKGIGRAGKKAVSGYFSPLVSRELHILALEQETNLQALMGEAFDDLMRKYGKHPFGER